jgi:lipoprotein signal peptidase
VPAETEYSIIDNIESNVYSIAVDTAGAAEELSTASEYQRKAGRRAACLGLIIIIVITVVLIAVWHPSLDAPHNTVLTFFPDFIVVGGCGCVIDDSYYGILMDLVYCPLLFSYDTHRDQLRADLSEAVGVRTQHTPVVSTPVTVANGSDQ